MTEQVKDKELIDIIGWGAFDDWTEMRCAIEDRYVADAKWRVDDNGYVECKYETNGKTLCALSVENKKIYLTVAFDETERDHSASVLNDMPERITAAYAAAPEKNNVKTAVFPIEQPFIDDFIKLLGTKRKFDK